MNLQSGYHLPKLRIVLISKIRDELNDSVRKLAHSVQRLGSSKRRESDSSMSGLVQPPYPERLPRRAWRVWYNKAPHAIGWSKRHYVFHDWRYAFDFHNVNDLRRTMSTVLGSLSPASSCVALFGWYRGANTEVIHSRAVDASKQSILQRGYENNEKKSSVMNSLKNADQSHQKHLYLNYRQYVGKNST